MQETPSRTSSERGAHYMCHSASISNSVFLFTIHHLSIDGFPPTRVSVCEVNRNNIPLFLLLLTIQELRWHSSLLGLQFPSLYNGEDGMENYNNSNCFPPPIFCDTKIIHSLYQYPFHLFLVTYITV